MRTVSILGSTGSVGANTVDVFLAHPGQYDVQVLTANTNVGLLARQARQLRAKQAVIAQDHLYQDLKNALSGTGIECAAGLEAVTDAAARPASWVMAAIVGMAGLKPVLAAVGQGTHVAIANKEPLVAAGPLVMQAARESGATLLPVDSEHNALFQVFEPENKDSIEKLVLTASGGPFRTATAEQMQKATPEQALNHPNWSMGRKISIDSATMANKALEVIEASYLFGIDADRIEVLVHPQSIVHSMISYADGSILAQMGASDMRTPIANALGWPGRINTPGRKLDIKELSTLTFEPVDHQKFPFVQMAYDTLADGPEACLTMNAANETAVAAFLDGSIAFTDIYRTVADVLESWQVCDLSTLDDIMALDNAVRLETQACIENQPTGKQNAL